ncbi:MAG: flagellar FlbD family protein [Clostridium sp.]
MIKISTLVHQEFYLNCELFEKIEANPDTVITMTNGNKYVVEESPLEILEKIKEFKRDVLGRF